jgi:ABC-type uncharacterized transport system permease subunit
MSRALLTVAAVAAAMAAALAAFGVPLLEGLRFIAEGSVTDAAGISRSLVRATPLLLTGLGMTVAWRSGMYNIGGEGQYVVGGLTAAALASALGKASGVAGPLPYLAASCAGGAAVAWIAGYLQVKRAIHAVISTILLNFVVLQAHDWLLQGPLKSAAGGIPQTAALPQSAMLPRLNPQLDVHAGLIVAAFAAVAVSVYLFRTPSGFRLRVAGEGPEAARAHGVDAGRARMGAMALSGALCGLAGGVDYTGLTGYVGLGFDQGWGFLGIPVALLGALHPAGVATSAVGFGALIAGCENLSRFTQAGTPVVYVVQGLAVLAVVGARAAAEARERRPADA